MKQKPDLREQANLIDQALQQEMPAPMLAALDRIVSIITEQLGDSQEKWYGATYLAQSLIKPLTDHRMESEQVRNMIALVVARLSTKPLFVASLERMWKEAGDDGA